MELYFLRHGHAEYGINISDHDRQLTDYGVKRMQTAARVMVKLGIQPKHIYSSPRVRAKQAADIVSKALEIPVEVREEVNFGFHAGAVGVLTRDCTMSDAVMFVGHEPTMSETISAFTGANVIMKKGGLARVDVINGAVQHGDLMWLIAPKVFDALGAE